MQFPQTILLNNKLALLTCPIYPPTAFLNAVHFFPYPQVSEQLLPVLVGDCLEHHKRFQLVHCLHHIKCLSGCQCLACLFLLTESKGFVPVSAQCLQKISSDLKTRNVLNLNFPHSLNSAECIETTLGIYLGTCV